MSNFLELKYETILKSILRYVTKMVTFRASSYLRMEVIQLFVNFKLNKI